MKRPLGIPEDERRAMLDTLLRLHKAAMHAFDCIEADAWDMNDLTVLVALPDTCNEFTSAMSAHALRMRDARV